MAALDFLCNECKEKFFEIVNSQNRDKVVCPKCGSKDIKQVFEGKSCFGKSGGGSCSSGSCSSCSGCH